MARFLNENKSRFSDLEAMGCLDPRLLTTL